MFSQLYGSNPPKDDPDIPEKEKDVQNILRKYPDRLPIYVKVTNNLPAIDKKKYLVPKDLTVGQFMYVCRKRLKLRPEQGVYMFFNGMLCSTMRSMHDIYEENKLESGLLVATLSAENTFG
jgi:GABA(A) receptor-associated protein